MKTDTAAFTARFRAAVEADGRTLGTIAMRAGVNPRTAGRLWDGSDPKLGTVRKFEAELGVPLLADSPGSLRPDEVAALRKLLAALQFAEVA